MARLRRALFLLILLCGCRSAEEHKWENYRDNWFLGNEIEAQAAWKEKHGTYPKHGSSAVRKLLKQRDERLAKQPR